MHTHAAPREVVAKAMGYAGLNGASATSVSALHKFGLLEKAGEEVKLSDRAMRILAPHSVSEREEAIREAAQEPELFRELTERFPGKIPNDDLLKNYLIRKNFAPAALSAVISAYRDTSDMVEREGGGYVSEVQKPMEQFVTPAQTTPVQAAQTYQKIMSYRDDDRQIGRYDFEGGAFVRITTSGDIDTEEALDMAQTIIDLKRKEIARKNKTNVVPLPSDNLKAEDLI